MNDGRHVLISLEPIHAEKIFSGKKMVEFRRRSMSINAGCTVWIYVKKPIGAVAGYMRVADSHYLAPSTLWKRFSSISGLSRREFFSYFSDSEKGFALMIAEATRLADPVTLERLRGSKEGFHPPQFFMHLHSASVLLRNLKKAE